MINSCRSLLGQVLNINFSPVAQNSILHTLTYWQKRAKIMFTASYKSCTITPSSVCSFEKIIKGLIRNPVLSRTHIESYKLYMKNLQGTVLLSVSPHHLREKWAEPGDVTYTHIPPTWNMFHSGSRFGSRTIQSISTKNKLLRNLKSCFPAGTQRGAVFFQCKQWWHPWACHYSGEEAESWVDPVEEPIMCWWKSGNLSVGLRLTSRPIAVKGHDPWFIIF